MKKMLLLRITGLYTCLLFVCTIASYAQTNVVVAGQIAGYADHIVQIVKYKSHLEGGVTTLGETRTDDAGRFMIRLRLPSPQPVMIQLQGVDPMNVWLESNDSIYIDIAVLNRFVHKASSVSGDKGRVVFSGRGAAINNYMFAADITVYNPDTHLCARRLSPQKYLAYHDSVQQARLQVRQQRFAEKFSTLAEAYLQGEIVYGTFYAKGMLEAYNRNMTPRDSMALLAPGFLDYWKTWKFPNTQLLVSPMCRHSMTTYYGMKVRQKLGRPTDDKARAISMSRAFREARGELLLEPPVRQFITASILYQMALLLPARDSVLALAKVYQQDYPDSYYDKVIRGKLTIDNNTNRAHTMAPKIEARDTTNRLVNLSELKGKVVYIDVWASWCGPCMMEFRHSVKLYKRLKDQIYFVYLNINDREDRWRETISARGLEGIHLRADKAMSDEIINTYGIYSIPRYILIDQNGKLVDAHAKRPGEVERDIRLLLD